MWKNTTWAGRTVETVVPVYHSCGLDRTVKQLEFGDMRRKPFLLLLALAALVSFHAASVDFAEAAKKKKSAQPDSSKPGQNDKKGALLPKESDQDIAASQAKLNIYSEGLILDADPKTSKGIISVGSKNGVKNGDKFIVVRRGEDIINPTTKKLIRVKQLIMGELEVTAANDTFSDVKFTKGASDIQKNDLIRSKTTAPAGIKTKPAGFRKMEIVWTVQPEPETKGYSIYRGDSLVGDFKLIGKTSKQEDVRFMDEHSGQRPMEDSKYYYYKIAAVNTLDKESPLSAAVAGTTMGPPAPPKNFNGEQKKVRAVPLRWDQHENPEVAGYKIYRGDSATGKFDLLKDMKGRSEKTFTDFGGGSSSEPKLEDARTFYYSISAYSPYNDEGPKSAPIAVKTAPAPHVPVKFEAKGWQPRKVPLSWKAHEDENVKGYYIYRSADEKGPYAQIAEIKGRDKVSFVDGGDAGAFGSAEKLKDFTLYFYKIEAYNWAGSRSGMSEAISATTKPAPMAPESFKATSNRPNQIPLAWRKNPETDIKSYHVYRADSENGAFRKLSDIPSAKNYYLDEKLENNKSYYYKIQAEDNYGLEGELSPVISGVTKSTPAPVSGLKWALEGSKVVLKWDRNKEVDATDYIIYQKGFFGMQKVGSTKELFFIVPDMKTGSKSDFAVSCVDADKLEGEKSGVLTVDLR